jgi:acetyltransferase-like isoleucine patch superfamily enzyme
MGLPLFTDWEEAAKVASHYVLALSDIDHRVRFRSLALASGLSPCSPLVSTMANITKSAVLGEGCVVGPFCWIGAFAKLSQDCFLMNHVIAGHDSVVGQNVVFCPGSNFAGYARIGPDCFIGSNAVISPKISIGARSFIAAGAACLRDAPEDSFLIGNPAKRIIK